MEQCQALLADGLSALNLSVNEKQVAQLLDFINLIEKWNKAYNLTAIKTKVDAVRLHLLDSLTVLPYLEGQRVIDIGTGAGLPGIPLAICLPQLAFTLLDSNAKKTRFVQQVVLELKLTNVQIVHSRVQDFHPTEGYNTALTRAFSELVNIVDTTQHLLAPDGILLAMKGQYSETELAQVNANKVVISVKIPDVAAERNLVCIRPNQNNASQ